MALIISVYNPFGGAGCTTFASVLGHFFSSSGNKVLMIDLDPLGVLSRMYIERMGLRMGVPITGALYKGVKARPGVISRNLHLVRSTLELWRASALLNDACDGMNALRRVLRHYDSEYDLIVIDCPHSMDILALNALSVSHRVVVPVNPRTFSSMLVSVVSAFIRSAFPENDNISVTDMFFNFHDSRESLCGQSEEYLREEYADLFMKSTVRRSVFVSEAANLSKDIQEYHPNSLCAIEFRDVCKELFERIEK